MQLVNFGNFKFANLNFYHYFFTAYIGLHISFSLLLGSITAFAPDEGLYKDIFSRLYSAGFTSDVLGFSGAWEPWLRLVYLPAKLLTYLGFSDLMAVRFQAIAYCAIATYLLIKIAQENGRDSRLFRGALISISFIPTVFLWSSIGLRECFIYLEIAAILYFLARVKEQVDLKNMTGLAFAVFSLAMTKNYIFILFLFAFLITLLIFSFTKRKNYLNHLLILVIVLVPLAVNPTLVPAISAYFSGQLARPDSAVVGDINNNGSCETFEFCTGTGTGAVDANGDLIASVATGGMTVHFLLSQLEDTPNSLISKIADALGITAKLSSISKAAVVLQTDKEVITNQKKLSLQQAGLKKPLEVIKSSVRFLLIPFIFIDNGSLFLNIQSIETPVWLFIYALFFIALFNLIRRRQEFNYAVSIATIFAFEFVAISALTEVNVGTALRHRSLLLIPILIIWASKKRQPADT